MRANDHLSCDPVEILSRREYGHAPLNTRLLDRADIFGEPLLALCIPEWDAAEEVRVIRLDPASGELCRHVAGDLFPRFKCRSLVAWHRSIVTLSQPPMLLGGKSI